MSDQHAEESHSSVKTYTWIAIVLAVLTAIEIAIPEIAEPMKESLGDDYNGMPYLVSLYGLMIIKFFLVGAFFMHLKYDTPFYTHSFTFALVIAVGTFVALWVLSPAEPPNQREARLRAEGRSQPAAVAVAEVEPEELEEPDPERGKDVFQKYGCAACHTISSVPGAVGTQGPPLDGLGQVAAMRVSGMSADAYIRESIADPFAFIVNGYMRTMPNMRSAMSNQEFEDLVVFLKGL